ncbi:MAG: GTPase ObgE [bacterium]|nr:GTPase ObgE [bacterium]
MFVDQIEIKVCAGKGGAGCVSFHHEKYRPLGGPDGGNGGKGGDIILRGNFNLKTLRDIRDKRCYRAENGKDGQRNNKQGRDGKNVLLEIPLGTQVYDLNTQKLIADITENKEEVIVVFGGKGGKGNANFATSTKQIPKFAEKGELGETKNLHLILKLVAEVGIIGYPNVGKSTLLSQLTSAKPKIADYPFTTLTPNLGVINKEENIYTIADLPGIIEGASRGHGLGDRFLRHIERTKILVHVIEVTDLEAIDKYNILNKELKNYNTDLSEKPQLLVGNKIDLLNNNQRIKELEKEFQKLSKKIIFISALCSKNIDILINEINKFLKELPPQTKEESLKSRYKEYRIKLPYKIYKKDKYFILESAKLERIIQEFSFENLSEVSYWHQTVEKLGINKALKEMGAQKGDLVKIGAFEFEFYS